MMTPAAAMKALREQADAATYARIVRAIADGAHWQIDPEDGDAGLLHGGKYIATVTADGEDFEVAE